MKPMKFRDEFEFIASSGEEFNVEVEGKLFNSGIQVTRFTATDSLGETVDDEHPYYDDIKEEAFYREYDVEIHEVDFDYYDDVLNFYE